MATIEILNSVGNWVVSTAYDIDSFETAIQKGNMVYTHTVDKHDYYDTSDDLNTKHYRVSRGCAIRNLPKVPIEKEVQILTKISEICHSKPEAGIKLDEGKEMFELLPPRVLFLIAKLYTNGAKKYTITKDLNIQELLRCCAKNVTRIEKFTQKTCVETAMRSNLEKAIQNMQKGSEVIANNGESIILTKLKQHQENAKNRNIVEHEIKEQSGSKDSTNLDSQKILITHSASKAVKFVVEHPTCILTTIRKQGNLEEYYAVSATTDLDSLVMMYRVLNGHSSILKTTTLTNNFKLEITGNRNWENGIKWSRVFGAIMRHLWKFWMGEDIDKETGVPHTVNALWGCMALTEYMFTHKELDDRPKLKQTYEDFKAELEKML